MEFFDRPIEEKIRAKPSDPAIPRGYQAFASRNLAKTYGLEAPPDLREQFFIGPLAPDFDRFSQLPQARIFYAGNIWPEHPARFRSAFEAYYRTMEDLAARLMRIFAVALGLPERYFDDKIDRHFNTCPTNHYPVVGDPPARPVCGRESTPTSAASRSSPSATRPAACRSGCPTTPGLDVTAQPASWWSTSAT